MIERMHVPALAAAALLGLAVPGEAQSIEQRVRAAPDGEVHFSYETRPGICGDGTSIIEFREPGRRRIQVGRGMQISSDDDDDRYDCDEGPARVALEVRGGAVEDLHVRVGSDWRTPRGRVTDLGAVPPAQAASYLLGLARNARSDVGSEAIFPATIARGVEVWEPLIAIARDERISRKVRKQAVFWVGQAAADAATRGLAELVDDGSADQEVRKAAIFALSQRPRSEGVPALIRVVRTSRDPALRRQALFWLGQSDDPRALELFEELLLKGD